MTRLRLARLPGEPCVVVLTRPAGENAELAAVARARGAAVVELPCLSTAPLPWTAKHLEAARTLSNTHALVFASPNGVHAFADLLARAAAELPAELACYAVGPATAAAVAQALRRTAKVARVHTGAGLLATLLADYGPTRAKLLLPAASGGRLELHEGLLAAGHCSERLVVYATTPALVRVPQVTWDARLHYIVCTSPSGVTGFFAQATLPAKARFVSIGPTTSQALGARGQKVFAEATSHDLPGLKRALVHLLEHQ